MKDFLKDKFIIWILYLWTPLLLPMNPLLTPIYQLLNPSKMSQIFEVGFLYFYENILFDQFYQAVIPCCYSWVCCRLQAQFQRRGIPMDISIYWQNWDLTVVESLRMEKTSKIIKPSFNQLLHGHKNRSQTATSAPFWNISRDGDASTALGTGAHGQSLFREEFFSCYPPWASPGARWGRFSLFNVFADAQEVSLQVKCRGHAAVKAEDAGMLHMPGKTAPTQHHWIKARKSLHRLKFTEISGEQRQGRNKHRKGSFPYAHTRPCNELSHRNHFHALQMTFPGSKSSEMPSGKKKFSI